MFVQVIKYAPYKGEVEKIEFNLETKSVVVTENHLTILSMYGSIEKLVILCRDSNIVDFISCRAVFYDKSEVTTYHLDRIEYYYENDFKLLMQQGNNF